MTTLLVSSVRRHTRPGEPSSFLSAVDSSAGRVVGRCRIPEAPYLEFDPNPRGGMRGGKGIAFGGGEAFVANCSEVFRYGPGWRPLGTITHPSCALIHDLFWNDGTLWAASARNDLVFQFLPTGKRVRHLNLRDWGEDLGPLGWRRKNFLEDDAVACGRIDFRDPRTHSYEDHDGAHVNSVAVLPGGDLLVLAGMIWTRRANLLFHLREELKWIGLWRWFVAGNRLALKFLGRRPPPNGELAFEIVTGRSAVFRVRPDGTARACLVLDRARLPAHNLLPLADGTVLLNHSSSGAVLRFDPDDGRVLQSVHASDAFLRGITQLSGSRVAVGSGNEVRVVDLEAGRIEAAIALSADPHESVYGVAVAPPGFLPLPQRLPAPEPRWRKAA